MRRPEKDVRRPEKDVRRPEKINSRAMVTRETQDDRVDACEAIGPGRVTV